MKILFIDGTKGFSPHRLQRKPTGGIITSLTLVPRYLAAQGHDVWVMSGYEKEEKYMGVSYTREIIKDPDIVVWNRNAALLNSVVDFYEDAFKIWWLHDIVQFSYLQDDAFTRMNKIVALSQYCMNAYSDFYSIPKTKFKLIPNGVDPEVFYSDNRPRNKNLYVCASAPMKGMLLLYPLKYILTQMKRHNPNFELRIYSSAKLHDDEDEQKVLVQMEELRAAGANLLDPIPQRELAEILREAYVFLMPNSYPEICSNLLLQAQSCGCPVVTSSIGSAPEFIRNGVTGLLTKTIPSDLFWWQLDLARLAVDLYFKQHQHELISKNSPAGVKTWDDIGKAWTELIESSEKENYEYVSLQ